MKKNTDRFLTATFCDDIRHEMGNKLSLMGCYQGELIVPAAPVVLPKLCVYASAWTPKERPFKSLTLRVVQDDEIELARLEIPTQPLDEVAQIQDATATRKTVSTAIAFSPFFIEKPMSIRLMAITEEGEIIGPRLLIKVVVAQDSIASPVEETKPAISMTTKRKPARKKTASAAR
ncbi:MAG: hypothetical protein Q8O34_15350 [Rhodocyclaceae bacterium]|nr:hypothetical protein [Rhodocyclaceae bacterium]